MKNQFFVDVQILQQATKKRVAMNVNLQLRDYADRQGQSLLYLVITSQGKRIRKNLDIKVKSEHWDSKSQRLRKSAPNAVETNLIIDNVIKKITGIRTEYWLNDKDLNIDRLMNEYLNASSSTDFIAFMKQTLEYQSLKAGSYRKEKSRIEKIRRFQNEIRFSEIDYEWIDKLKAYMEQTCKNNANTIDSNMRTVKKYLKLAKKYGIRLNIDLDDIKMKTHRSNRTNLSMTELNKLKEYYFSPFISDRIKLPLGYFLFSCYSGLRINEVKKLRRKDIGKTITFTSDKTDKTTTIPLNNTARSFVEHYDDLFIRFISDQKMNDYIREAVKFVGIRKHVSFHVARHTFATNYLRKGGKVEDLQNLLDHSSINTTMVYVHMVAKEKIDVNLLDD